MGGKPEQGSAGRDRFLAHQGLIAVACGAAMAEAGALVVAAPAARALAPQVTALTPLAVFHDLRWLYIVQPSLPVFGMMLAGLVVARSALDVVLIRLAWPAGLPPPGPLAAFRNALPVTALACLLMSPFVSLTFGVAILPFSWPFLAMLPAMLLIALPVSHAGVVSWWWRTLPPGRAVSWVLAEFVILSAAAAVSVVLPAGATVPVAGAAGLVNARAWFGLTTAAARPRPAPARAAAHRSPAWALREIPGVPLAIAVAVSMVIVSTRLVFVVNDRGGRAGPAPQLAGQATAAAHPAPSGSTVTPARAVPHPVLEIFGFGSSCCPHDRALARALPETLVQQFSYRGTTRRGVPMPYGPADSNLLLSQLGDRIAAQVWQLHRETGEPVDLVAESEGTLGVYAMLAQHRHVPVGSVALLSPIVAPGQVGYPAAPGVARAELHAIIWFVGGLSPFGSSGAQRLIDSVNSEGARFAAAAAQGPPVRSLEIVPLADAVTLPACRLPANVRVVPAFHGELLGDATALHLVRDFLTGQHVPAAPWLRDTAQIMAAAATAWRMPQPAAPTPPCRS